MSETIQTINPDPNKKGVNISKQKYDVIHSAICTCLKSAGVASLASIMNAVKEEVGDNFEGSVGWYVTTVKLDMEGKGELVCDRSKSPHEHFLK